MTVRVSKADAADSAEERSEHGKLMLGYRHREDIEMLTSDAAEKAQGGRITAVLVDHALVCGLRLRYRQSDRFVELASAGFYRHYG